MNASFFYQNELCFLEVIFITVLGLMFGAGTAGESSVAGTAGVVTIVRVYGPLRMHFRKASPFGLVSMYRKNRDRHCAFHPVAALVGQSLEPAPYVVMQLTVLIMTGRSTRSNTANNTNPPNEIADEVTRQLNITFPNLLTQLVQALGGNQANQKDVAQICSIKTFRASSVKEFFSTEGAVGLLTWFESIESVLHITKHPAKSQVEFTSSMLQGRALTWWNTLFQTRGRAATIAQPWDDFKKLVIEEYCPDVEVQKLESEFWNHKMVGSDIYS
ncbi:putative reverse transcriptase domain-containing protein [Tanacetum coccineum]